MTLATKNGAIIVNDGKLAENCGCCGGWYCYGNSCSYTYNGNNALWVCGVDPPSTITLRVTYSGEKWCSWQGIGGDEKGPTAMFQQTVEASTSFNGDFSLSLGETRWIRPSLQYAWYTCGYAGLVNGYTWSIGPGTPSTQESLAYDTFRNIGDPWEAILHPSGFPIKVYQQRDAAISYSQWQATQPQCTTSTSGTTSVTGTSAINNRSAGGYFVNTDFGAFSDGGPYTTPNPTLSGLKWSFTYSNSNATPRPFCVVEVVG
jgi:hypothetical protein